MQKPKAAIPHALAWAEGLRSEMAVNLAAAARPRFKRVLLRPAPSLVLVCVGEESLTCQCACYSLSAYIS